MSATLVIFGGTLTGMLTWISGTYVLHLKALPGMGKSTRMHLAPSPHTSPSSAAHLTSCFLTNTQAVKRSKLLHPHYLEERHLRKSNGQR